VEKITEYLCEPLGRALKDEDPYVRKTAAVCVAKLYDISPDLVEERGFLDTLRDLISDANPTVVANAVAALSEIGEVSGKDVLDVTAGVLQKLLTALNECTEWGQVFILDSLSKYEPADSKEAEGIIERVAPRLQHANSAVVISAVKVILKYMDEVEDNPEVIRSMIRKLAPPLVTLLNSEPEIQFVALRNINLIVQKRPKILEHEIKVFFCKYNDPIYVKMEKLEIIIKLASISNIEQVLLEFKEYATEVDVDFVRKAVRAIGRCAIKLERAAERCIHKLLELIETKVNYVVQEAVVVIKDIFRKYPNRYESIIATLCDNLEELDEPEAKASMVWIIGEYAERIDNADELLDSFLESFADESAVVQLQLLTATVKLFLKAPETTQDMVQRVLTLATEESDNPDLRDRGYVYWRLLSSDPEAARAVVLSEKPEIADDTYTLSPQLLEELIGQIATLASIYHKPSEAFVSRTVAVVEEEDDDDDDLVDGGLDMYGDAAAPAPAPGSSSGGDLLDLMGDPAPAPAMGASGDLLADLGMGGGGGGGGGGASAVSSNLPQLCSSADGLGIAVAGVMVAGADGNPSLQLTFTNSAPTPVSALAIQLNKNALGLAPNSPHISLQEMANGSSASTVVSLKSIPASVNAADAAASVKVAIKNVATNAVFFFDMPLAMSAFLAPAGPMDTNAMVAAWKSVDDSQGSATTVSNVSVPNMEDVKAKLGAQRVAFCVQRQLGEDQFMQYFSCQTITGTALVVEIKYKQGLAMCKVTVKSPVPALSSLVKTTVAAALS
jgi:AP-1 complex subunit beta-1